MSAYSFRNCFQMLPGSMVPCDALWEYGKEAPTHQRWSMTLPLEGKRKPTINPLRVTESSRSKAKSDPSSDFQSWFAARLGFL